jgi:hypothetical protein
MIMQYFFYFFNFDILTFNIFYIDKKRSTFEILNRQAAIFKKNISLNQSSDLKQNVKQDGHDCTLDPLF